MLGISVRVGLADDLTSAGTLRLTEMLRNQRCLDVQCLAATLRTAA